jgi:hypothetical protein
MLEQARHDAIRGSAKAMDRNTPDEDERQKLLRQRARQLIAKSCNNSSGGSNVTEVISVRNLTTAGSPVLPSQSAPGSSHIIGRTNRPNGMQIADNTSNYEATVDFTPTNYTECEIEFLERSLKRLDERATGIEWSLRRCMLPGGNSQNEEQLTCEWFALVDERNELVRRIEQLNALAHEKDLERRFELLSIELRHAMAETGEQDNDKNHREQLLLAELISIVNQRDELVKRLDAQEQEITSTQSERSEPTTKIAKQQCTVQ